LLHCRCSGPSWQVFLLAKNSFFIFIIVSDGEARAVVNFITKLLKKGVKIAISADFRYKLSEVQQESQDEIPGDGREDNG
jgi:hypothetical protein